MKLSEFYEEPYVLDGQPLWLHCFYAICLDDHLITPYHYHDYIEMIYIVNGTGTVYYCGSAVPFSSRNLFIIGANEPHGMEFDKKCEYYCVKFMPFILSTHEQSIFQYFYTAPFLASKNFFNMMDADEITNINVEECFHDIIEEVCNCEYAYDMMAKSHILKVFSSYLRKLKKDDPLAENIKLSDRMQQVITYVIEHYDTVTAQSAADYCHLSYNYFSHVFKKETGVEFKDFLMTVRIKEAKKLLLLTDKDVTNIAQDTGFATSSHFAAAFKKYTSMTPLAFRKSSGISLD